MKGTTILIAALGARIRTGRPRSRLGTEDQVRAYASMCLWRPKAVAKAVLPLALLAVICSTQHCLADGKVFPPLAFPANVTIPDQRALIHFTNGTERLVIETRFSGAGTNFAWVVPLPSLPVIEEATTGLFNTLAYQLRPRLVHNADPLFAVFVFCMAVGYLLLFVRKGKPPVILDFVVCGVAALSLLYTSLVVSLLAFLLLIWAVGRIRQGKEKPYAIVLVLLLVFLLSGMLLPTLGTAGARSISSSGVTELARQRVGVFDTRTIAARTPRALLDWLQENEFAVPTNAAPVIADYISNGWVFVAAKIHRESVVASTNSIHPLSFTFQSKRALYPLRLTGVGNGPLRVELYVFGTERAEASHFNIEHCASTSFPQQSSDRRREPTDVAVMHPLLRRWVQGGTVVTKLVANLSPEQSQRDVDIGWVPFAPHQRTDYSRKGAAIIAANWATGLVFALLLVATVVCAIKRPWQRLLGKFAVVAVSTGIMVFLVGYFALPKVAVRLVRKHLVYAGRHAEELGRAVHSRWATSPPKSLVEARQAVPQGETWSRDNILLGGKLREEDSPGNYVIRETADGFQFVWFDSDGSEHRQE